MCEILRQHINVLNYPSNFTIMDEEDQKHLLKALYTIRNRCKSYFY